MLLCMQRQEQLDPELAAAWFKLLSQYPSSFDGQPAQVSGIEKVIADHSSLAVDCLLRREEALLRTIVAFLRSALVFAFRMPVLQ